MKKIGIYFSILFFFIAITCQGQELKMEGFKVLKHQSHDKSWFNYSETSDDSIYSSPKGVNGKSLEFTFSEFDSRVLIDSLEKSIFLDTEIEQINSLYRCIASFTISSADGKIVKVDYVFKPRVEGNNNSYPEIDLKKLKRYSQKIKENLNFKLHFSNDIYTHGYITLFYPIFVSTRN